jgi:hypothetical protein
MKANPEGMIKSTNLKQQATHNMLFKPHFRLRLQCSDVPFQASFANGFAILSQTLPSTARRLTRCYVPRHNFLSQL